MKVSICWLIVLLALVVDLFVPDVSAQRRRHRKEAATDNPPSASLAPLVQKLDGMLGLNQPDGAVRAEGELRVLRASFVSERVDATPERQRVLDAAIWVCDLLTKAFQERRQAAANAKVTKQVKVSPEGTGKAAKKKAREADAFFRTATYANWKNRKTEMLNQVNAAYNRLQSLEAQPPPAKP